MTNMGKIRINYFMGFTLIVFLLGLAEYLEIYQAMTPCPLCMLQRFVLILLGVMFFVGMIFRMKKPYQIVWSLSGEIICILGILLSGRQVWLQHMPQSIHGECGASLSYVFHVLPFTDAIKQIWVGGTECSQQGWVFWHLTLAEWSLLGFVGFFVLMVVQLTQALSGNYK